MTRMLTAALYGLVFLAVFVAVWLLLSLTIGDRGRGETAAVPPTVCAAGQCAYATATPWPTWDAATAEAWATYEAVWAER